MGSTLPPTIVISSLATRRRVAAIGDSIAADALGSNTATSISWTNWGFLAWMRRFLNQRMDFPIANILAVPGTTVAQAVSQAQAVVALGNVDICIINTGTNSLGAETTVAMQAEYAQIINMLRQAGIFVIVCAISAHNGGLAITGASLRQQSFINKWLANFCRLNPGTYYFDVNPYIIDFATGNAGSAYLRDGIHLSQAGAIVWGQQLANVINGLVPANQDRFTLLGDVYDATNNPAGNLLANGLLAGSGGTTGNGGSGVVPTSWWGGRSGGSGTVTAVYSAVSDTNYTNLYKLRMTLGGVADTNSGYIFQQPAAPPPSPGSYIWGACDVVPNITTANVVAIYLRIDCQNVSYASLAATIDGTLSAVNGDLPVGFTTPFSLRTEPLLVPAGTVYVDYQLFVSTDTSGALTAAVDFERCEMRIESYPI